MNVAQLTDPHIVPAGRAYFGIDTASFLEQAIAAVNALDPIPAYAVVTGDVANSGGAAEYARFREIMSALRVPYFVIPGNHDDREQMRAALAPETLGGSRAGRLHYAIEDFPVRLLALDGNAARPWPGAILDAAALQWLDRTLAAGAGKATIVAVHQPPFRTGLHYLDVGGFVPRHRLRRIVDAHPQVVRVISGHIHCVRTARWKSALAITAPSTAPQLVPLLFSRGRLAHIQHEQPGFAVHEVPENAAPATTIYRRDRDGEYAVEAAHR